MGPDGAANIYLTEDEAAVWGRIPETDLVEMAVELDIVLDEHLDRSALIQQCLLRFMDRIGDEGLPVSKYDAADIMDLPADWRDALASHIGVGVPLTARALIRHGKKTWKLYQKRGEKSQVGMLAPLMVTPIARHLAR